MKLAAKLQISPIQPRKPSGEGKHYTRDQIARLIGRVCAPETHYADLQRYLGQLTRGAGIPYEDLQEHADLFEPFISPESATLAGGEDSIRSAIESHIRSGYSAQVDADGWLTLPESDFADIEVPIDTLDKFAHLRITDRSNIPWPDPVVTIGGEIISTPKNITLMSGHAKSGKSAFLQPVLALCLSGTILDPFDGLEVKECAGKAVIFIDTEQADFKQQRTLKAIAERAQLRQLPDNFLAYNFRLIPTLSQARETLKEICTLAAEAYGGVHLVVVDGIADLIADVNDPAESAAIVRMFEMLAVVHNCPVITILHLNPGGEAKERGHLGSHLQRKAESVLRVSTKGDVSTLEPAFLRNAGKARFPLIQFQYDPLKGYHVCTGHAPKEGRKGVNYEGIAAAAFGDDKTLGYTEAVRRILEHTGRSLPTAKRMLREMKELDIIRSDEGEYWINNR